MGGKVPLPKNDVQFHPIRLSSYYVVCILKTKLLYHRLS